MAEPITDIVIVGGGTAGWLAAAYLNHRLQWAPTRRRDMRITVIESPDVPTVGVGEATVPTLRQTLKLLDIDENEFIARTSATFKVGIRFENWNVDPEGKFTHFFHPFTSGLNVQGMNPAVSLLAYGDGAGSPRPGQALSSLVCHAPDIAEARKGPRLIEGRLDGSQHYAYHLDAGAFATFLSEVATARGVEHVRDRVQGCERDERGHISALQLERGGRRPTQLVIDCTGFQGLLINKQLDEPFISYADYLLNDRAIPIQVAHAPEPDLYPATISTARRAGWSWRIPLQTRMGTGYVFSSRFISDREALDESLAYLGEEILLTDPRVLHMRVGRCRRSWVGNCVAIGLSSGFIEPLESTAILMIELACRRLLDLMPSRDFEPMLSEKFNTYIEARYDEVRDFLGLHFSLNNRTDTPYWIAAREEMKRSDRLNELLSLWRLALPDGFDRPATPIFSMWSINCVLLGKDFYRAPPDVGAERLPPAAWSRFLRDWRMIKQGMLAALPDHGALVAARCARAVHGASAGRAGQSDALTIGGDSAGAGLNRVGREPAVLTPGFDDQLTAP